MLKCKLGQILDLTTPAETVALSIALIDRDVDTDNYVWSARRLSAAIAQTPYSVGATTIKDHRNEMCGCFQ